LVFVISLQGKRKEILERFKKEREWTKACPIFSFLSLERRKERESREQRCQSTETTISIHFRTLYRSVGVGRNSSSDFFSLFLSLFVLATQSIEEREKKKK
jgi:hypothetical protein